MNTSLLRDIQTVSLKNRMRSPQIHHPQEIRTFHLNQRGSNLKQTAPQNIEIYGRVWRFTSKTNTAWFGGVCFSFNNFYNVWSIVLICDIAAD